MKNVLITGANRGIGLNLVERFLASGSAKVIACCRNPANATDLQALKQSNPEQLEVLSLDVTDQQSVDVLVSHLDGQAIDVLVNNAGVYLDKGQDLFNADFDKWAQTFEINTISPFRMIKALHCNLKNAESPKVMTVSSQMGSMSLMYSGSYAYCSSKAAVNKISQSVANDLRSDGICVAVIHPGWVQTDMGGSAADITPEDSANGIYTVIEKMTLSDTGSFFKWNGEIHAW